MTEQSIYPDRHGQNEHQLGYLGWRVVLASMVALAFGPSTIAVMSLGLFFGPLEASFGWPRTEIALATTIVSYMIVIVSPLQGYLTDRFGARPVMLLSIPAFAIGIAALYFLPRDLPIYYLAWAIIPFLGVGLFPLGYLKIVSTWFSRKLGLAIGIANSGIGLGGALLPLIVGTTIAAYGWREAYLAMGIIILFVTFPIVWLFVRERAPADGERPGRDLQPGLSLRAAIATTTFKRLALAFLLLGVINTALIVHQVPLLIDSGVTPARAAIVQSFFGLSMIVGRLVSGLLLDYVASWLVLTIFALGASVACALYAMGVHNDGVFVCAALIGLVIGAEFDVLSYMVKAWFGLKSFGKIYGVIFSIFQFGAGFGAALLPLMRGHYGSYAPGLWMFVVTSLLSVLLLVSLKNRPEGRTAPLLLKAQ